MVDNVAMRSPGSNVAGNYDATFKIIVVGESGVGKSAFSRRHRDGIFPENLQATIGTDIFVMERDLHGRKMKLQIWDTAGQERFHTLAPNYYRHTDGVILMYDVTSMASFTRVPYWLSQIHHNMIDAAVVVVGNKLDMVGREVDLEGNEVQMGCREVPHRDGVLFAGENCLPFFETSAKTAQNLDDVIFVLTSLILKARAHRESWRQPAHTSVSMNLSISNTNSIPEASPRTSTSWFSNC